MVEVGETNTASNMQGIVVSENRRARVRYLSF